MLLSPIALKVVGPFLLESNSSRDGTNPYIATHKQGNKETTITKDQKNEMKAKPIDF